MFDLTLNCKKNTCIFDFFESFLTFKFLVNPPHTHTHHHHHHTLHNKTTATLPHTECPKITFFKGLLRIVLYDVIWGLSNYQALNFVTFVTFQPAAKPHGNLQYPKNISRLSTRYCGEYSTYLCGCVDINFRIF